jgi:hypothetical protein
MIKLFAWLRTALFGKTEMLPVAEAERAKVEPITVAINVDTSELKAALPLLEQIKAASQDAGAALILAELKGLRADLATQHEGVASLRIFDIDGPELSTRTNAGTSTGIDAYGMPTKS